MAWVKAQVRLFVKRAKDRAGPDGWVLLGRELREGLLAVEFANVITGQAGETIKVVDADELWKAMRLEMESP